MTTEYPPTCQVVPTARPWGPGWYLIARNKRVEAGPFHTRLAAERAAAWMDEQSMGVNPGPWKPILSPRGLTIGTRVKGLRNWSDPSEGEASLDEFAGTACELSDA